MASNNPPQPAFNLTQICESCFLEEQQKLSTLTKQLRLQQKREQLQQKLQLVDMKALIARKQKYKKQQKLRRLKQKIVQLKSEIVQQQLREQSLKNIKSFYSTISEQKPQQESIEYLQKLKNKNERVKKQVQRIKKEKKKVLENIMRLFLNEERKYKIRKYFRVEEDKNIIFTLENATHGIPVIKANNQQVIRFYPLEEKSKEIRKYDQANLIETLKITHKFMVIIQKVLLNNRKLPYKMYFSKQYYYIANTFIKFDHQQIQLNSLQFLNFINMLQANIEYLAFLVGLQDKPFLVLDRTLLEMIDKNGYEITANKNKGWRSFLKYLNPKQIQNHYQEEEHASQVIVVGLEKDSDQEFEVLEWIQ